MSLAVRLKELRLKSRKSLQAVADAVGASKGHLWELEHGKASRPSIDLIGRLAKFYGVSVSELVGEVPTAELDDRQLMVMYRDLQELDEADRTAVQALIDAFKERRKKAPQDET